MSKSLGVVAVALLVCAMPLTQVATAQDFGIPRSLKKLKPRNFDVIPDSTIRGSTKALNHALGAAAVTIIGVAILETLSEAESRELSRRTLRLVRADLDREIVDVYTIKKGKKKVTIRTSPAKPKVQFTDDPALKPAEKPPTDPEAPSGKDPKPKEEDDDVVVFEDLSEETLCRTQTVEVADAKTTKTDAPSVEETNTVLMCELKPDDWRPAKSRAVAANP